MKTRFVSSLVLGLGLLVGAQAVAGPPTDYVRARTDEVTKLLSSKPSKKRSEEVRKLMDTLINFRELAARSLGKHWEARTEEEKTEFLSLLQELVRANYEGQFDDRVLGKDFKIEYLDEKARESRAVVKTTIEVKGERKPVDYKLAEIEGTWTVFDVVVDDISLEETYRDAYVEIIEEEGWGSLIQRMKDKVKETREEAEKKKKTKK